MAQINIPRVSASLVEPAPLGYITLFADENNIPRLKDNSGSIIPYTILNAASASYAATGSIYENTVSSSYGLSGSVAISASYATFAESASFANFTKQAVSGAYAVEAKFIEKVASSSYATTAKSYGGDIMNLFDYKFPNKDKTSHGYGNIIVYKNRVLRSGLYGSNRVWGMGSTADVKTKIDLPIDSTYHPIPDYFTDYAVGDGNIWALGSNGYLYMAGDNAYGQIGDGTTTDQPVLTPLRYASISGSGKTLLDFWNTNTQFNASTHYMGTLVKVNDNGTLKYFTWGENTNGNLGVSNNTTPQTSPVEITDLQGGDYTFNKSRTSTYAVSSSGQLYGCGQNTNGQLGQNNTTAYNSFQPCQNSDGTYVTDAAKVMLGVSYNDAASYVGARTLVLTTDGKVKGAGRNNNYQLGIGSTTQQNRFVYVTRATDNQPLTNIVDVQIGRGYDTQAALDSSGNLWAWGTNYAGWFGDGTALNASQVRAKVVATNVTDFWLWSSSRGSSLGRVMITNISGSEGIETWAAGANQGSTLQLGIGDTTTGWVTTRQKVLFPKGEYAVDIYFGGGEDDSNPSTDYYYIMWKTNKGRIYFSGNLGKGGAGIPFFADSSVSYTAIPQQIANLPF